MAGTLNISTLSDGTNSTSATNCIKGSAKAWAYDIQTSLAIGASYNISSVTLSSSTYTINFTTPMPNNGYSAVCSVFEAGPGSNVRTAYPRTGQTVNSFTVVGCQQGGAPMTTATVRLNVAVFG